MAATVTHLPTATFRSARAACRIRTPESLIRPMPASSAVCWRTTSTACSAVFACFAILQREQHDRDHDDGGHRDHHDAQGDPEHPTRGRRRQHGHLPSRRRRSEGTVTRLVIWCLLPGRAGGAMREVRLVDRTQPTRSTTPDPRSGIRARIRRGLSAPAAVRRGVCPGASGQDARAGRDVGLRSQGRYAP